MHRECFRPGMILMQEWSRNGFWWCFEESTAGGKFHWKWIDCVWNQVHVFHNIFKSNNIAHDSDKSGFDMPRLAPGIQIQFSAFAVILFLACAWDSFPLRILFSSCAGDRSNYRSYFQLVLGICPTTDPIFSLCWGKVPLHIQILACARICPTTDRIFSLCWGYVPLQILFLDCVGNRTH